MVWTIVFLNAILSFSLPRCRTLTAIGDLSQCLLISVAFSYLLKSTKTTDRRSRLFWAFLSVGCGLWLVVQLLWTFYEVWLGQEVPNPFTGDVALFLHLVPMMAALAVRPDHESTDTSTRVGSFDFALLLVWWLSLYLFFVIPWQYVLPNELVYGRSFDFLYLLEHFVFLACLSAVWLHSSGGWKRIYGHLLGASSLYAASSIAASFAIDLHKYYTGSIYDIPLLGAMAWFAGVAPFAQKLNLKVETGRVVRTTSIGYVSAVAMLASLSLPVMGGWALYDTTVPAPVRDFRLALTLIAMMAMGTITWMKQRRLDEQLARAYQDLREDSLTDLLTGARNRRFFANTIEADTKQAIRAYSAPGIAPSKRNQDLIFYLIDADSFKEVNDRYGHDAGDELLLQMARRISSAIRYSDILIRWGGDEFLVLSRYTDRDDCVSLSARVLSTVGDHPFQLDSGVTIHSTCSIGWAVFPWFVRQPEAISYEDVLRLADAALYEAKKTGRNRGVGMLPKRHEPDAKIAHPASKLSRLTEQLGAETIMVKHENISDQEKSPAKSFSANCGSE